MSFTLILNKYPTKAVKPIAFVPKKVILNTAFRMIEPLVFAAVALNVIKKKSAAVYSAISIFSTGKKSDTRKGKAPPIEKAAPKAKAGYIGLA